MDVVGVMEFGGPEALQVVEVADPPAPGPGEVKIRVHAATVNPTDTYMRNGAYAPGIEAPGPPYIPGMDAAGEVLEVGADVDGFRPGDRVMAVVLPTRPAGGAYAQQIVVPAASVARAPEDTSHAEASTLPMNGLTARQSLDQLGLSAGQTLAVTGAAGSYGGYVIQLAKVDGLRVVADASESDEELVRGLGADVVVRRGDDVADRIRAVVPDGVDGLADGSVQGELLFPAIRDGGGMAVVRGFKGEAPRGIQVHPTWVGRYATETAALDRLGRLVEEGAVTLRVAQTFPADHAAEAHALLEHGGVRGRLVIEL